MAPFSKQRFEEVLRKTEEFVKEHCEHLDTAHDWDHVDRVRNLAKRLYISTFGDQTNVEQIQDVELIALLHDVGDFKFGYDQKALVTSFIEPLFGDIVGKVHFILDQISCVSWRKSLKSQADQTEETQNKSPNTRQLQLYEFVSDADRLDAMGFIGVARCLSYSGSRHSKLYDFSVPPNLNLTKESYDAQTEVLHGQKPVSARSKNNALNHFYEKLFKLKDSLKTQEGKRLGEKRHQRLVDYVDGLLEEINLES